MSGPVGMACPGCQQPPLIVLGGGTQAFCRNDSCRVFTWNPMKTLAELVNDSTLIDLGDFGPPSEQP